MPRTRRKASPAAAAAGVPGAEPTSTADAGASLAAAAAAPSPPPLRSLDSAPTRLEREVELLVGLDVEYTHLRVGGRHVALPAEVCAVDAAGAVMLYEHCNPLEGDTAQRRWRHVGGAPPAVWRHARPLAEVRATLSTLLAGRVLVGHHLRKDLAALGLHHPQEATRDTLRFSELQGRRGGGRRLRDLSAERLGRAIQPLGRRHSAREDAQAALDLYLQAVHFQQGRMGFEDLVERELANILAAASSCSGSSDGNQRECS